MNGEAVDAGNVEAAYAREDDEFSGHIFAVEVVAGVWLSVGRVLSAYCRVGSGSMVIGDYFERDRDLRWKLEAGKIAFQFEKDERT